MYYNIHLFPEDLDYINNRIRPHPIFSLLSSFNTPTLVSLSNILVFHETLLNDPTIPNGIETVIDVYNASNYKLIWPNPQTKKDITVSDYLNLRRPLIELWFEMVNLTR